MKLFISHASEDKESIAKPLAETLQEIGYEVWYDEYSLKLGDSLMKEIDKGLNSCDYGIVIISPHFLEKHWPQKELAGLVAREAGEETEHKIILPVWHKISADQIREYSPTLADRVAVSTETGLDNVVREIKTATTYIETPNENPIAQKPRIRSASNILNNIVHAGPIQPDGGLMPASVKVVEELVERWNKNGYLNLVAKVEPMSREYRKSLFNTDKSVFLFPGCGMHQVRIEVIDKSYQTIGMIWTPPNVNDNDYHKALGFFLQEMGFLQKDLLEVEVMPIVNSDDSFFVSIRDN